MSPSPTRQYPSPWDPDCLTEDEAERRYLVIMGSCGREELLRHCRRGGYSAHRLATGELPALLWLRFGRPSWRRQHPELTASGRGDS